jgi:hypothetical protein
LNPLGIPSGVMTEDEYKNATYVDGEYNYTKANDYVNNWNRLYKQQGHIGHLPVESGYRRKNLNLLGVENERQREARLAYEENQLFNERHKAIIDALNKTGGK